jgi:hypothetical protein
MGKSKKVGKMRFYPMLAAWLEFARSDEIRETSLQHDTPIPAPPAAQSSLPRSPPHLATRGLAAGKHALRQLGAWLRSRPRGPGHSRPEPHFRH